MKLRIIISFPDSKVLAQRHHSIEKAYNHQVELEKKMADIRLPDGPIEVWKETKKKGIFGGFFGKKDT